MLNKLPEEFTYEYVVMFEGEELAVYYSDAIPPEVGTLLNPWEFVPAEAKKQNKGKYMGPYRVVEVNQQPKKMDGNRTEVASQTMVNILVEK